MPLQGSGTGGKRPAQPRTERRKLDDRKVGIPRLPVDEMKTFYSNEKEIGVACELGVTFNGKY